MPDAGPAPYDHYRPPATGDVPDGVYRVVGVADGSAVLLAVADADGRRINSGRLVRVPADRVAAAFEPAPNPDEGLRPGDALDWVAYLPRALWDLLPGR
ncbi:MAG: hypothetical protein ABEH40_09355 [Haloferacaceae archaeon]